MKLAIFLAMLGGAAVALQTSFNAAVLRTVGPFFLVAISGSTTGLVGLSFWLFFAKPQVTAQAVSYAMASGVLGAVIVSSIAVAAGQGGVSWALSFVVGTQLLLGLLLDRLGILGAGAELSLLKVLGIFLILVGGVLIIRN